MSTGARRLVQAAAACHIVLLAAVGSGLALRGNGWIAAGAAAAVPLAVTLPGLIAGSARGANWAAFMTVIYAAAATVEMVARSGAAPFATAALLAALGELALLFALSRRLRAARG